MFEENHTRMKLQQIKSIQNPSKLKNRSTFYRHINHHSHIFTKFYTEIIFVHKCWFFFAYHTQKLHNPTKQSNSKCSRTWLLRIIMIRTRWLNYRTKLHNQRLNLRTIKIKTNLTLKTKKFVIARKSPEIQVRLCYTQYF